MRKVAASKMRKRVILGMSLSGKYDTVSSLRKSMPYFWMSD